MTGRVGSILEVVSAGTGAVQLARLAVLTGIPKPTVRRIANRLVDQELLSRDPDGYRLGLRLIDLGSAAATQLGCVELAAPYVHELYEQSGQVAWVGTIQSGSLTMLDAAFAPEHSRAVAAGWPRRLRTGLAATAAGHLLLADQPEQLEKVLRSGGPAKLTRYTVIDRRILSGRVRRARETGIAREWEEARLGWWCCAVLAPVPGAKYVFGMTGRTYSISPTRGLAQLQRTAAEFTRNFLAHARRGRH